MYDLENTNNFVPLTKEDILEKISEEEILRHYLGFDYVLNKSYISPLRKDTNPSFAVYYNQQNQLRFKDFNGAQGSCFDFVMMKFGMRFFDAIKLINKDLKLGLGSFNGNNTKMKPTPLRYTNFKASIEKKKNLIQFKPQYFTETDKRYWTKYSIKSNTLVKFNVFSAKYVFLNKKLIYRYIGGNPVYCYKFSSGHAKVYRPLQDKTSGKWLSNVTQEDIQGLDQLKPSGKLLIITKSLKDVMCLFEMGYSAIAPQSEGAYIKSELLDDWKKRFTNIVVFYDNDDAGKKGAETLAKQLNCDKIFLDSHDAKDISDFIALYGMDEATRIMNLKLQKYV